MVITMKNTFKKLTTQLLTMAFASLLLSTTLAHAGEVSLRQFVVTLDNMSGAKLSASQVSAATSDSADSLEHTLGVSLQEEFRSKEHWYEILKAVDEQQITEYLSALELSPLNVIQTEFTNGPTIGGGPKAGKNPKTVIKYTSSREVFPASLVYPWTNRKRSRKDHNRWLHSSMDL